MTLPPKAFYALPEAAARWGCTPADIAGWSAAGRLEIVTGLAPVRCGSQQLAGFVAVPATDILPVFRRCGTGPGEWPVRRIREVGAAEWLLITDPEEGVPVAAADLVIRASEVARFEEECGIMRRPHGTGPTPRYDWDGFYLAVIKHLHEQGLPESQNEFVGMMQEWFIRRSESGDAPDESTIRRRINPIWRALRE